MNTASITLGGWLGDFLTRLAVGATPIDGVHESTVEAEATNVPVRRRRSRHFGASQELAPARDQTQFIRGLS